jgi:uncharacterized membrane protein
MQTWYYSSNGERQGPVSFDELKALARRGALDPVKDLAWTEGMQDWTPSGQVAGLFSDAPMVPAAEFNPYAAPATSSDNLLASAGGLTEIHPGSAPLELVGVVKRAIELTKRDFGKIILIGIAYLIISAVIQGVVALFDNVLGLGSTVSSSRFGVDGGFLAASQQKSVPAALISFVASSFLLLGLNRVALNIASGEEASVAMLFSQGSKLLRMLGAFALYYLMVVAGLILLIVPGIYLALRFGLFQYAIVDRNLGVIDSLKYSSKLTEKNRLNLFGLGILMILVMIAGALALVVGMIFAIPVVTLALPLAYRFLQFGPRALTDHPGTKVPVLRGHCSTL